LFKSANFFVRLSGSLYTDAWVIAIFIDRIFSARRSGGARQTARGGRPNCRLNLFLLPPNRNFNQNVSNEFRPFI